MVGECNTFGLNDVEVDEEDIDPRLLSASLCNAASTASSGTGELNEFTLLAPCVGPKSAFTALYSARADDVDVDVDAGANKAASFCFSLLALAVLLGMPRKGMLASRGDVDDIIDVPNDVDVADDDDDDDDDEAVVAEDVAVTARSAAVGGFRRSPFLPTISISWAGERPSNGSLLRASSQHTTPNE